jgi:hypothetical protein
VIDDDEIGHALLLVEKKKEFVIPAEAGIQGIAAALTGSPGFPPAREGRE